MLNITNNSKRSLTLSTQHTMLEKDSKRSMNTISDVLDHFISSVYPYL